MKVIYCLYHGDMFIDVGTAKEISRRQDINIETVYRYASKYYHNKYKDKPHMMFVYKVEE